MSVRALREMELQLTGLHADDLDAQSQRGSTFGSSLSGLMGHGGFYALADAATMGGRRETEGFPVTWRLIELFSIKAQDVIAKFFYYLVEDRPYVLHSRLISYLTYPNVHLRSPLPTDSYAPVGKTFVQNNLTSPKIPAAMTFVGQFIDHDLTLNGVNLFDPQDGVVKSQASPLIDLDSVYGPRIDDKDPGGGNREIPMDEDGRFRLRAIPGGFDVCRRNKNVDGRMFGQEHAALIGDKRNDENQIILQIHLLLMRLHNRLWQTHKSSDDARTQTILHWQSMVATEYLPLVCDPDAVAAVLHKLQTEPGKLVHQPNGVDASGKPILRMPHEFAIGFRFGHSQLRSRYRLNPHHEFRLFDSLSNGANDLQGGKCLTSDRLIDWPYFLHMDGQVASHPSNLIDTKINQVVFDLPESTIPDEIVEVGNLPFRNLVRSSKIKLCAGEDLAELYAKTYPAVVPLTPAQVEKDADYRGIFKIDTNDKFRTPLWYYLLREAEVARDISGKTLDGHLGPLGSYLVAEVVLSGIWHATPSFLRDEGWTSRIPVSSGDNRRVRLIDIAKAVADDHAAPPACISPEACSV